jgi:uncharacterized protein (DUF58 family)
VTLAASIYATLIRGGQRTALGVAAGGESRVLSPTGNESGLLRGLRVLARVEPAPSPDLRTLTRKASTLRNARVFLVTTRSNPPGRPARAKVFGVTDPANVAKLYESDAAS